MDSIHNFILARETDMVSLLLKETHLRSSQLIELATVNQFIAALICELLDLVSNKSTNKISETINQPSQFIKLKRRQLSQETQQLRV